MNPQNNNKRYDGTGFNTIKPNIAKIFASNVFNIVMATVVIYILYQMIQFIGDFEAVLYVFESFNVEVNVGKLINLAIAIITVIAVILFALNYLVTRSIRYEFYKDRMILYRNRLLVFSSSEEIGYEYIGRITSKVNGIFNLMFRTGTIVIELSGYKKNRIELDFIDHIALDIKSIQNLVRNYMSVQQTKSTEQYEIDQVFDRPAV